MMTNDRADAIRALNAMHATWNETTDAYTRWMDDLAFMASLMERFPDDWVTKGRHAVHVEPEQKTTFL